MDSAKNSGGKRSVWANITPSKVRAWMVPCVVVLALVWGFLAKQGL